jgi:VWFA-related protein
MRAALTIAASLILVRLALLAQAPSGNQPTFRAGVDVVQVDVTVLDKDRRPIRGLTAADFTVLEDGKPRPVVAFVPVDLPEPDHASVTSSWLRDVPADVTTNRVRPEGRLVVIMFDWSIRFEDQALAKKIAAAAVDQLGPNDLAAVVFTSAFANAGAPQNFTNDRARLLAAINQSFAVALHNPPNGPGHDPRNRNLVMIDDPEGYESGDCHCRVCVPETIGRVADAVRDVQGRRKTLIFVGTYFRAYESLRGPQSRQGPEFKPGLGGKQVIYPGECSGPLKDAREKMERATSLANLTIHTLDPVGIETEGNSPLGGAFVGIRERQDDLKLLADMTGGRTVMHTSSPEQQLGDIFGESHSYYLLAFAPAVRQADGRYHKIDVKVNRPGVNVRTRSGYYAGETRAHASKPSIVDPETVSALEGVLPRTDVPLSVNLVPFALPGKTVSAVAVVLGVRQAATRDGSRATGPVKVLAAAFDRNGRAVQSENQTVGITLPANAAGDFSYEVLSRLELKPGRYEVRVAIDASAGQRASVYSYVDVPDFAQQPLSLSGVAFTVSPADPIAPPQGFPDLLPIVPTARRDFARTDRADAFLRVYQKLKDPPQTTAVRAQIQDAAGRIVTDEARSLSADQFAANGGVDYRLALPVERLEPGEYLLTIDATQGRFTARRGVRFRVR